MVHLTGSPEHWLEQTVVLGFVIPGSMFKKKLHHLQEGAMRSFSRFSSILCLAVLLAGCATTGDSSSDGYTAPFYISEFSDVPIPSEMEEKQSDTYISFAPSGLKCGVQHFSGRVQVTSLMNTIRRYMADSGWTLRALLRSKESVLVFEKTGSICTMHISDGMIYTDMVLFMSPRLDGDSPNADFSAYGSGGTAQYGGSQPLNQ